jgi:hypothetical protein
MLILLAEDSWWEFKILNLYFYSSPNTCPPERMTGWPDCAVQAGRLGTRLVIESLGTGLKEVK